MIVNKNLFNWFQKVYITIFVVCSLIFLSSNLFSQEGDSAQTDRYNVFMGPRMYPFDSIPGDAYYNMMNQMNTQKNNGDFYLAQQNWSSLGPNPINYKGTSSGRVSCVAFDPNDPNGYTIILGSCGGGVWKSTNLGLTWVPKNRF